MSVVFHVCAAVAVVGAGAAVFARRPAVSLAGFAIALAGLIVPLLELQAPIVAGLIFVAAIAVVGLLAGVARVTGETPVARRRPWAFWIPAGVGLAGFVWVFLATGSRQFVEPGEGLDPRVAREGGAQVLALLGGPWVVPTTLVALLALAAVSASVLTLAHTAPREST